MTSETPEFLSGLPEHFQEDGWLARRTAAACGGPIPGKGRAGFAVEIRAGFGAKNQARSLGTAGPQDDARNAGAASGTGAPDACGQQSPAATDPVSNQTAGRGAQRP